MTEQTAALTTPLYDLHRELGGKMVPFAGYDMPVQYPGGIIKEHLHTRSHTGLFDVSHMGQVVISGANVTRALEALVPVDLGALGINQQTYAVFTNESGGILDDLIITRWQDDQLFLVVNAACKAQDIAHLQTGLGAGTSVEPLINQGLLALQGPTARQVIAQFAPAASELVFMTGCHTTLAGTNCYITCSGYTGEDGFEISLPASDAERIARLLLAHEEVAAIGLGARDSLRLEAGLCLYGHDMDTNTSAIEASLLWSISKSRRPNGSRPGGFAGADAIFAQLESGASRKRVGLQISGRVPVREGAQLVDANGETLGIVTSGGYSPSLQAPIAMGYLNAAATTPDTELFALVRGKQIPVQVSRLPFVPQRYYRG